MAETQTTPAPGTQTPTLIPEKVTDPRVLMQHNITKLESSDFYKKLDPHKKVLVQTQFYNKYVKNAFPQGDSDLRTWLKSRAGKLTEASVTPVAEKAAMAVGHGTVSLLKPLVAGAEKIAKDWDVPQSTIDKYKKPATDLFAQDEKWMEQHYDDNLKDSAIKEVGTFIGQTPAMMAAGGILKSVGLTELLASTEEAPKMVQIGNRMLHTALEGYMFGVGTGSQNPTGDAAGFAIGGELFRPVETYLGKLLGLGGRKLVSETVASTVEAISKKAPEATHEVAPIVAALAGSPKQKIHATTINMLNDIAGGDFVKASPSAQAAAIAKLGKMQPEIAGELGFINEKIVEAKAAAQTLKQRALVPEFNDVLTKLEKVDGTPTPKAVASSVAEKAKNRRIVKNAEKISGEVTEAKGLSEEKKAEIREAGKRWREAGGGKAALERFQRGEILGDNKTIEGTTVPGAASAKSYEFEDNLSKRVDQGMTKLGLGKDKLVWEDRGHKLLFYLNLLLTDQKELGASKERNKQFQFLLQHLNDRYKGATLPDLVKMSDNLWTHIERLTKAGVVEEGKPTRIFRQTELREGESPFGHQVKLLHDAQTYEINERMDQDAFNKRKPEVVSKKELFQLGADYTDEGLRKEFNIPDKFSLKELEERDIIKRSPEGQWQVTGRDALDKLTIFANRKAKRIMEGAK